MKEEINIGTITDNKYIQHTGAWAYSMLKNCSEPSRIHFWIFESDVDPTNKKLMKKMCDSFNAKLSFLVPEEKLFNELKLGSHLPRIIYCKLYFSDKLKDLHRIIVLDSDIIVEGDIKELWDFPLNGKTVGAVPDAGIELGNQCKTKMGIPLEKEYLNSGVMLIDCDRWRKREIMMGVINFIKNNPEKISVQDQDGLNYVLQNDWQELPYEWNVVHPFYYHSTPLKKKLGKKRFNEIIKNPKIIHFTVKPWVFDKVHPLRSRYWHYLRQTPWKDYKYTDKTFKNALMKGFRLIIRPIPWETKVKVKDFLNKKFVKKK